MLSKKIEATNPEPFNNKIWRDLLSKVCREIDKNRLGLQVISPFGFELLEDKKFLYRSIKRLYCYIGISSEKNNISNPAEIANLFFKKLIASIGESGIDASDIAILAIQDKFRFFHAAGYQCTPSDKLIDIQVKVIHKNILHDYANYVICTIDSIFSDKEEPKHFFENKRHRCRTFQIYVMLEKIFGYLLPKMSSFESKCFVSLFSMIDNRIQMFYEKSELLINASEYEAHILNFLIKPRVALIRQVIKSGPCDVFNLQCDAYHIPGKLELMISKDIYDHAVNKIKMTYLNYQ